MHDRTVGIIGTGPAIKALQAILTQPGYECVEIGQADLAMPDFVAVSDTVGASIFETTAAERDHWLAIEHDGLGGQAIPDVEVGVSIYGEGPGCFQCLCDRVAANLDEPAPKNGHPPAREARFAGAIGARLVETALTGEDPPLGTVIELPYTERLLLPVPHCNCAPSRDWTVEQSYAEVALETAIERAERAIDPRLGIVQTIGEVHSFPVPYYLAACGDTSGFSDATAGRHAAGVAVDWNRAFMKAIGEALERYCAGIYRTASFTRAKQTDLADPVPPSRFVHPNDMGLGDDREVIDWNRGEDLLTNESVYLPAECVVFPPPAERLKPAITTGLGLGSSGGAALLAGLYEIIERDAVMLAWYSTYEPLGLRVDDELFDTMRRRAGAENLAVTALLVTQDIDVPVVTVAVHRESGWPRFAVGSSAHLDPDVAARGALEEALQNWLELKDMGSEQAAAEEPRLAEYANFPDAAEELLTVDGWVEATHLQEGETPSGEAALTSVLARLEDVGLWAYAVGLTTRDLEELGFEAVRVVVPEAQPLFTGDSFFGERATTVPGELGFDPVFDRQPHPYP